MTVLENATGWNELMTGNITGAAFVAIDQPLGGYLIVSLYVLLMLIIWMRTQAPELCAVLSIITYALFRLSPWFTTARGEGIIILMTVTFIALTFFKYMAKEQKTN